MPIHKQPTSKFHFAIDGNEANITQRVGSNVYAFQILKALHQLISQDPELKATILLSNEPQPDWPKPNASWQYKVIKPSFLWTQFAAPSHLFLNQKTYDAFYTPGHYAPRLCPMPYISSVMDLAYLKFPDQYRKSDLIKLKHWTRYSIKQAKHVIAISQFTKQDLINQYQLKPEKILVAPPAMTDDGTTSQPRLAQKFFDHHQIKKPYFLFIGTFQPRKNLIGLIEAYEQFCRRNSQKELPQLVLAGQIGWLAESILERIKVSPFSKQIITPGYVPADIKFDLYQQAVASILVGFYEGFGLPPLESLVANCLPIVANSSSLPEVVGPVGLKVDPANPKEMAEALAEAYQMTKTQKEELMKQAPEQLAKFSWEKSAQTVLQALKNVKK